MSNPPFELRTMRRATFNHFSSKVRACVHHPKNSLYLAKFSFVLRWYVSNLPFGLHTIHSNFLWILCFPSTLNNLLNSPPPMNYASNSQVPNLLYLSIFQLVSLYASNSCIVCFGPIVFPLIKTNCSILSQNLNTFPPMRPTPSFCPKCYFSTIRTPPTLS